MTREELEKLGLFQLREYGMRIGVRQPTEFKKSGLIDEILAIESGEKPPHVKKKSGRPAKMFLEKAERQITEFDLTEREKRIEDKEKELCLKEKILKSDELQLQWKIEEILSDFDLRIRELRDTLTAYAKERGYIKE